MAKDSDHLAGSFDTENTGGFLTGLLAEEDNFDRRTLWRLGSWGTAAVGAVVVGEVKTVCGIWPLMKSISTHEPSLCSPKSVFVPSHRRVCLAEKSR